MSAKWRRTPSSSRVRVMMDRYDCHRALCRVGTQVALEALDTTGQSLLLLVNMRVSPDSMGCSHVCAGVCLTLARPYRGCSMYRRGSGIYYTPRASEPQPEQEATHGSAVLPTSLMTEVSLRTYRGRCLSCATRAYRPSTEAAPGPCTNAEIHHPNHC